MLPSIAKHKQAPQSAQRHYLRHKGIAALGVIALITLVYTLSGFSLFGNANDAAPGHQEATRIAGWYWFIGGTIPLAITLPFILAGVLFIVLRRSVASAARLALTEARISNITEAIPAGLLVINNKGTIIDTNPEAERILGLGRNQLIGSTHELLGWKITTSNGSPWQGDTPCRATIKTGKPATGIIAGITTSARQCWINLNTRPLHDEQGNITAAILGFVDITDSIEARDKAIAAQSKAESLTADMHRLALVAERTTNAVIITDAKRRILWVNDGFTRISEYTLEEVVNQNPGSFLQFENTSQDTVKRIREALAAGVPFRGEILNRSKTGREYWLDIDIQPLHDEQGNLTGFLAVESDITDQVKQRTALAEREQQFRTLVNNIPGVSYRSLNDATWTMLFISDAIEELTGYPIEDYTNNKRSIAQAVHPDDLQEVGRVVDHAIQRREPYSIEYRMIHRDGSIKWVTETGRGIFNTPDEQEPAYLDGALFDITARKEAEAASRRANAELEIYRRIVDHHAIVSETDRHGNIISVNDAFCQISGYPRDELIGQNHCVIRSGTHPKSMWTDMYRTLNQGSVWHGEICNRTKSGDLYWVDSTIAPLHDESGRIRGYYAIRTDITELKRARAVAEAASEAKSLFLANMSHEIRTPLTAILGYTDILREQAIAESATNERIENLATIKRAGTHLLTIINDILDISKIEAGKMSVERIPTQIDRVLADVHRLLSPRAKSKGVNLITRIATPIPATIESDPTKLRQILMNLVGNATKFTEEGSVTITAAVVTMAGYDTLRFDIEDTGPGLTQEQTEQLFVPFFQADSSHKRKYGGTGLGLTISQRFARLMQGEVWLERTELGKGSCFSLIIPIVTPESTDHINPVDQLDASIGNNDSTQQPHHQDKQRLEGRILLAEDGLDNQQLIAFHLRKAGATVDIADNGQIALDMLNNASKMEQPYDLLLTDIQMPEMDGFTLARTLREQASDIPIIAITAHAMAEDRQRCLDAGCNDYSSKPINQASLIAQCRQWIEQRSQNATKTA